MRLEERSPPRRGRTTAASQRLRLAWQIELRWWHGASWLNGTYGNKKDQENNYWATNLGQLTQVYCEGGGDLRITTHTGPSYLVKPKGPELVTHGSVAAHGRLRWETIAAVLRTWWGTRTSSGLVA